MSKNEELYEKILLRLSQYMQEKRASTQPQKLADLLSAEQDTAYDPKSDLVRESLIEHVGFLPVLATTMYPYIKNENVDLGLALLMLAIHDIGETVTGDTITFLKSSEDSQKEEQIALEILEPEYKDIYLEMEHVSSDTARFAKSMDKCIGDFLDILCPPSTTIQRYKSYMDLEAAQDITELKRRKKQHYFEWDPFLKNFYAFLLSKTQEVLSDS